MKPYQTAKVEGEKLAKQYANLETVSQTDIFNGLESYYSVLGQDKNQKPVAVLIEKSSNNIYVYQLENGTSQEKAEAVVREKEQLRSTRLPSDGTLKSLSGKSSLEETII